MTLPNEKRFEVVCVGALALAVGLTACDDAASPPERFEEPQATVAAASGPFEVTPERVLLEQIGSMGLLTAELVEASGKGQDVDASWSSRKSSVVSVDRNGWIRARSAGTVTLVGSYQSMVDSAIVTVGPASTGTVRFAVSDDSIPVIGDDLMLAVEVLDTAGIRVTNPVVSFSTPTQGVITLTPRGGTVLVTGVAAGTGQVVVQRAGFADTATVRVGPAPTGTAPRPGGTPLQLAPDEMLFDRPNSMWFVTAKYTDPSGTKAVDADFRTTNASVVQIDDAGWVRAAGNGSAKIIGTYNGQSDTISVQVGGAQVDALTLQSDNDTISAVGDQVRLHADVLDPAGRLVINPVVTWSSLQPQIATVSGNGGVATVTGVTTGTASIVARRGARADTGFVHVGVPSRPAPAPGSITITPDNDTIPAPGGTLQLSAVVTDAQGQPIPQATATWSSLDPSIATIGSGGVSASRTITGVKTGTARITATAGGKVDTARVHVGAASGGVTWTVAHTPSNPTTSAAVTISATASNPAAIASIRISVGGSQVKNCSGGTCSHSSLFPSGPHTYSIAATDISGKAINAGSGSFHVSQQQSGGGSYSPTSPHWRHMRTSTIDYRIHYQRGSQQRAEYDWAAGHFDHITGGDLNEYKKRNPTIRHFPYDTYWFTEVSTAGAAEKWLAANGYNVENAYLHKAGTSKTKGNRITAQQYAGRNYWYYNMGDPGFRAWRRHYTQAMTGTNAQGYRSDGLFFDTNARHTAQKYVPATTLEYGSWTAYFSAFDALLASHRTWVPAGYVVLNQSTYFNKPEEQLLAAVAGGTMLEFMNGPYRDPKWSEIDALISAGVVVEYGTAAKANHKGNIRYGVTPGNYLSVKERVLMWEYASYLMVVDPNRMDLLYFEPYLGSWDRPMNSVWLKAFEYDIGLATNRRNVLTTGTDGAGQTYRVWQRTFQKGLVLIRKQEGRTSNGSYDHSDRSAVNVTVPAGQWRLLLADGSVTGPVSTVKLRTGEAVILVK